MSVIEKIKDKFFKNDKDNVENTIKKVKCYFITDAPYSACYYLKKMGGHYKEGTVNYFNCNKTLLSGLDKDDNIVCYEKPDNARNFYDCDFFMPHAVPIDKDRLFSDSELLVSTKIPNFIMKFNGKFQVRRGNDSIYIGQYFVIKDNKLCPEYEGRMFDYKDFAEAGEMKNYVKEILKLNGKVWNDELKKFSDYKKLLL